MALWLFIAAAGWVAAALLLRSEPRLWLLVAGLGAGLAGALAPAAFGQQGGAGFLASFPLAFGVSFAVCAVIERRPRR